MKSSKLILTAILFVCGASVMSPLSAQDVRPKVPDELVELFFKDLCPPALKCTDEDIATWRSNFKYEVHDLNGDKIPELFLLIEHQDWCGAGSNCDYSIYMKSGSGYKLILSDKVLKVMKTRTHGYLDIESQFPLGVCTLPDGKYGWEIIVTSYKFDGKKYEAARSNEHRCLKQ